MRTRELRLRVGVTERGHYVINRWHVFQRTEDGEALSALQSARNEPVLILDIVAQVPVPERVEVRAGVVDAD